MFLAKLRAQTTPRDAIFTFLCLSSRTLDHTGFHHDVFSKPRGILNTSRARYTGTLYPTPGEVRKIRH